MFKKLSAFILSAVAFLSFSSIAFASDGSFSASNYCFNPGTGELTFDASSFSPSIGSDDIHGLHIVDSVPFATVYWSDVLYGITGNPTHIDAPLTEGTSLPSGSNTIHLMFYDFTTDVHTYSQGITVSDLTACPTPTSTPTPSPIQIEASPSSSTWNVGTQFNHTELNSL